MQRISLWTIVAIVVLTAGFGVRRALAGSGADAMLQAGATAPNFTLPSQDNTPVSLSEYRGKWVVLYFYPKDMTQGCTIEAHNFQADQAKFTQEDAAILGVSLDTTGSHKKFCTKENLTFKLLADPQHKVVDEYGVPVAGMGPIKYAKRVTFLISPEGRIVKVWPDVQVQNHATEVLEAIQQAKKS